MRPWSAHAASPPETGSGRGIGHGRRTRPGEEVDVVRRHRSAQRVVLAGVAAERADRLGGRRGDRVPAEPRDEHLVGLDVAQHGGGPHLGGLQRAPHQRRGGDQGQHALAAAAGEERDRGDDGRADQRERVADEDQGGQRRVGGALAAEHAHRRPVEPPGHDGLPDGGESDRVGVEAELGGAQRAGEQDRQRGVDDHGRGLAARGPRPAGGRRACLRARCVGRAVPATRGEAGAGHGCSSGAGSDESCISRALTKHHDDTDRSGVGARRGAARRQRSVRIGGAPVRDP